MSAISTSIGRMRRLIISSLLPSVSTIYRPIISHLQTPIVCSPRRSDTFTRLMFTLQPFVKSNIAGVVSVVKPLNTASTISLLSHAFRSPQSLLAPPAVCGLVPARAYKFKVVLKRRCPSCYFVRHGNRLFVHCTAKPRHKQMEKVHRRNLFRED